MGFVTLAPGLQPVGGLLGKPEILKLTGMGKCHAPTCVLHLPDIRCINKKYTLRICLDHNQAQLLNNKHQFLPKSLQNVQLAKTVGIIY